MPEQRTELEKEELGLYQEQKHEDSNLDKLGKIACYIVMLCLIGMIIHQLNK